MFEHAQHIKKEMRTTKIHDQQNWRKNRSGDGSDPHRRTRKIDMVKNDRAARGRRGHSCDSSEKEIERNLPRPHRRFHHGLTVVTTLPRNGTTDNIDTTTGNDSLLPRFLAQLFESLFRWRICRHEKNANARSVAMIDAIAVANAEVHADFR
jgi:hypothetical protein